MNELPQTSWLKTRPVYCLTVPWGRLTSLLALRAKIKAKIQPSAKLDSCPGRGGSGRICFQGPSSCWLSSRPRGCRSDAPTSLLAVSWASRPASPGLSHPFPRGPLYLQSQGAMGLQTISLFQSRAQLIRSGSRRSSPCRKVNVFRTLFPSAKALHSSNCIRG